MLSNLLGFLWKPIESIIFRWMAIREARQSGKVEQQRDDAEASIKTVDQANDARDRLNAYPEYAERVRDRFTRQ